MKKKIIFLIVSACACALLLLACAGGGSGGAQLAVELYVNALVENNTDALLNASCASWEAAAQNEIESFAAVAITLEDMRCQEKGNDGEFTLVACTGKIVANYGSEVLEINLADRTYRVIQEAGEWRVCGYQ